MGFFDAVGNFLNDVGNAVSTGISNLTGGNSSNKSSNKSSNPSSSTTSTSSASSNTRPTPGKGNYGGSSSGGSSSSTSSSSSSSNKSSSNDNRSNSAGAQALTQQIDNNKSDNSTGSESTRRKPSSSGGSQSSGVSAFQESIGSIVDSKAQESSSSKPVSGSTGNSIIDNVVSSVQEIVDDAKTVNTNKPTTSTAEKSSIDDGLSLGAGSILGSIIEDKPAQTVTEAMRGTTSESKKQSSVAENVIAGDGLSVFQESIGNIFNEKTTSSSTKSNEMSADDINLGVINTDALVGISPTVDELNQPVSQNSVDTDTMVGLDEKPKLSLLPNDYDPLKVQSSISTLPDGSTWQIGTDDDGKITTRNMDKTAGVGVDLIYRDPSLVGIHTFDSKEESEAFLKQLYTDGNYDWTDTSVPWYDTQSGDFIGYLGEEAYPYAVIVPETYDAPIRLEFNTGGSKGGSPATDTGKSSWTDVPSAKVRNELRQEAGFDFGFSSKNLDYDELVTQNERRGYDESWFDAMVGQNTTPYDAEKGGYDARTSNVSVADVKSGKVDYATLSGVQGGKDILNADALVIPTIDEKVAGYMGQEGLIAPAEQDIRAYFTIEDAIQRGVAKQGGYWYEKDPILSGIFGALDKAQEGVSQFSSDLKAGNIPFANVILGVTNPLASGLNRLANEISPNDVPNPMIAGTTWGLGVIEGALGTPKSIASLDENVKAARSELGDDALVGLATPAALGMSNILANYYKNNPTDALFDVGTLATGGAGIIGRVASTASKLSKLDKPTYFSDSTGMKGVQINDKIYGIDPKGSGTAKIIEDGQITKEVRLPQTFIRDTKANIQDMVGGLKTRMEDKKVMRDLGDSSQRSSKYSKAYVDDSSSPILDGDFSFKDDVFTSSIREKVNDKSSLGSLVTRDIDSLIKNDRAKPTSLIFSDDKRRGGSSLILRDRDSALPVLRDRDSNLPILRDKDDGIKSLVVRDKDGALVVRDKDKQIPYVPKDRNIPPVHRKKDDNKILPFLDELGDLFGGQGDGGLTGGTYWGRGRGRSWRVENEDIADASQFSGLF